MAERRAGGFVDRGDGKGWVLDDTPAPKPPKARPRKPLASPISQAGGWRFIPEEPPSAPEPEPEPEPEPQPEPEPEAEEPNNAEVRAWAKEQGIEVSDRGKIPADVLEQYLNREK